MELAMDVSRILREELTCAVCLGYFTEPVTIDCGHSFCRGCLAGSWGKLRNSPLTCPECRGPVEPRDFQPNLRLGKLAAIARRAGPRLLLGRSHPGYKDQDQDREEGWRGLCERHQRALKLFCQEDEEPLCVACLEEGRHGPHSVSPLQEAADDCKVKIEETLAKRWKELEKAQQFLALMRTKAALWKERVQHQKLTIQMEFEKIRGFLAEEESRQLLRLELEEEAILRRLEHSESQISQQSSALRELIGELEERCEKPDLELLRDVKTLLSRSEATELHVPQDVSVELRSVCYVIGMREMLCKFQVPMTLDENTAHPCLVLSDDRLSVSYSPQRRDLPENPERFDRSPFVLASKRFTSGRYFWEVKAEHSSECILGVCEETRGRKGSLDLSPLHGFWAVTLKDGYCCSSKTRFLLRSSPRIVGIYLDYRARMVSFYNMTNRSHLYTYQGFPFSGPLRPLFAPCIRMGEKSVNSPGEMSSGEGVRDPPEIFKGPRKTICTRSFPEKAEDQSSEDRSSSGWREERFNCDSTVGLEWRESQASKGSRRIVLPDI
ncbi:E3 ubiquitin-protein ligase TRIM11-like [Tachyglossus aculeatus]|uniref:E3 ubiquitin-protein ligase TRIM11-like n=1 Tax=Tachyglossus aculeatus TaxID=9261 RepID=UPI0018F3888B|nr:E3 ubiquitin-protein ligase TRIM11-like [Tachyglossus aculeatus]